MVMGADMLATDIFLRNTAEVGDNWSAESPHGPSKMVDS